MSHRSSGRRIKTRLAVSFIAASILFLCFAAPGCGQAAPEETVYKFLGAVQSHDYAAMRTCTKPEALLKVEQEEGNLGYQWEELHRRYRVKPVTWRMEFEGVHLDCSYLDSSRALVRLAGGRCRLYNLEDETWIPAGEIDFSEEDFSPLYVVLEDGKWYLEALDLYLVYRLECLARI